MRVVALEKGARGVVKVGLDSGSFFLFRLAYLQGRDELRLDPEHVEALLDRSYSSGLELEGEVWEALLQAIQRAHDLYAVEKAALAYLARREHSRVELEKKLRGKEFDGPRIHAVLDRLEMENLLSDKRFTENWIRSRLRSHPEGAFGLQHGLQAKGVQRSLVKSEVEGQREAILLGLSRYAERLYLAEKRKDERRAAAPKKNEKERKKGSDDLMARCYSKLRSRGYSYADIKQVLQEITGRQFVIDAEDGST
jgi:regulatory protein